jgi:3-hydroxybutyryl-CoA dehydratase
MARTETVAQQRAATFEVGSELPAVVKTLDQQKIDAYARSSGDGNPLHTDPVFAAETRFGGTIAHGMLILAYVSEMLTAGFGPAWLASGRLKIRFRAPARPGDMVTAGGRVLRVAGGVVACEVECRNEAGEVLVSGDAEVTV